MININEKNGKIIYWNLKIEVLGHRL